MPQARLDLVIVGGGIAGLWLLDRVVRAGHSAIVLERGDLGGGQTIRSQGIIHGGMKYALGGTPGIAAALADMPERWRQCLAGRGEIDLRAVRPAADGVHVWLDRASADRGGSPDTRGMGRLLRVHPANYPEPFRDGDFAGPLYRTDEVVVDVPSLLRRLTGPIEPRLIQADLADLAPAVAADGSSVTFRLDGMRIEAARLVIVAGDGAPDLARSLGVADVVGQRRPLRMTVIEHAGPAPAIFAHCVDREGSPMVTITTHASARGGRVWYVGGGLAEAGAGRSEGQQIAAVRATLEAQLPWVSLVGARWSTLLIDRAEPAQPGGRRPDRPVAQAFGPVIVGWPTKLALAPALADAVLALLPPPRGGSVPAELDRLPRPPVARAPWDAAPA